MATQAIRFIRTGAVALACAALAACGTTLQPSGAMPVAPLSHSVEQANHSLEEASKERAAIEAAFAASEQVCAKRFFVNSCLEQAREKRRGGLAAVRAVEIEAEYFKRKASADERDRALAEAQSDDALRAAERAGNAEKEAAAAAAARAAAPPAPPSIKSGLTPAQRKAQYDAKMKREAELERADAPKHAAKAAAFERKKEESARRQRKVADKKAAKAAKAAQQP